MNKDLFRQFAVIFTTLFTLISNALANALPLNNRTTGEISDSFGVYFVPAGYVFSIWGVIYLGLLAYTVVHSLPSKRSDQTFRKSGWWVALSSVLNGAWIYLWHYGLYAATLVVIVALLAVLLVIYLRLNIGRRTFKTIETWTLAVPISLYLGWITVAPIANATAVLSLVWDGAPLSGQTWTVVLLAAGVVIAGLMAFTRSDIAYLLVLIWAFSGISVRWQAEPVLNVAGFAAAAVVLFLLVLSRVGVGRKLRTA